jgi:hypothetical protein
VKCGSKKFSSAQDRGGNVEDVREIALVVLLHAGMPACVGPDVDLVARQPFADFRMIVAEGRVEIAERLVGLFAFDRHVVAVAASGIGGVVGVDGEVPFLAVGHGHVPVRRRLLQRGQIDAVVGGVEEARASAGAIDLFGDLLFDARVVSGQAGNIDDGNAGMPVHGQLSC